MATIKQANRKAAIKAMKKPGYAIADVPALISYAVTSADGRSRIVLQAPSAPAAKMYACDLPHIGRFFDYGKLKATKLR